MSLLSQSIMTSVGEVLPSQTVRQLRPSYCQPHDARRACMREQELTFHEYDVNGDGRNDEIAVTLYSDDTFTPGIFVRIRDADTQDFSCHKWAVNSDYCLRDAHGTCDWLPTQRLSYGLRAKVRVGCGNVLWKKQASDSGARIGDVIDVDGEPWSFEGVDIDISFVDRQLKSALTTLRPGRFAPERVSVLLRKNMPGPGSRLTELPLSELESLRLYSGDLRQQVDDILACREQPNEQSCLAAAQATQRARVIAERLLYFERVHYEALAALANAGAVLVARQRRDALLVRDSGADVMTLPSAERLFQLQTSISQLYALFGKTSKVQSRAIADAWLAERFGLGREERMAIYEASRR